MDLNRKFLTDQGEPCSNPGKCDKFVGKLNPYKKNAMVQILKYIKNVRTKDCYVKTKGKTLVVGYSNVDSTGFPVDRRYTSVALYHEKGKGKMWLHDPT